MPDGSAPSPSPRPRFRLAIVGGGIAGLTLSVALGRYDDPASPIEIHMYESGKEITTVGAGISVWPRTWGVMRELGVFEDLSAAAVQPPEGSPDMKPGFVFRKSNQTQEGHEFGRVMVPSGATTMHRADMVDVLVKHLPASCTIHTSKRLTHYTESPNASLGGPNKVYTLHFADGTSAEADIIIGADGIKSKTRATMYEYAHQRECRNAGTVTKDECERCKKATPKWTGTVAYRYLLPTEHMCAVNPEHNALKIQCPLSYSGKSKHIITYPISHGKYLNWIGFVTIPGGEGTTYPKRWVIDASKEELIEHFSGFEPEVDQMIQLVEKPQLWAIHEMGDLPFSVSGRVALMGDAVQAMRTHFGAGGGQAIEDAYVLGRLLADKRTTLACAADVLRIYQDARLPFGRRVVSNARQAGLMYEFDWPGLYDGFPPAAASHKEVLKLEKQQLKELGDAIQKIWEWQWLERVEDVWDKAEKEYDALVSRRKEISNGTASDAVDSAGKPWSCVVL